MRPLRPETLLMATLLLASCAPTPEITEQTDKTAEAIKRTTNLKKAQDTGKEIYPADMLWHSCETNLPVDEAYGNADFRIVHRIPKMPEGNFGTHQCEGHGTALHYIELQKPTSGPALTLRTYTLGQNQNPDEISTYTTQHNTWVEVNTKNTSGQPVFIDITCPVQNTSRFATLDLNLSPTNFMVRCNADGSVQLTTEQFQNLDRTFTKLLAPPSSSKKAPTTKTATKNKTDSRIDVSLSFEAHEGPLISQGAVNTLEILDLIEDLDRNNNSYQSELYIKCHVLLTRIKRENPTATKKEIADIFYARALKTNLIENLLTLGRDETGTKLSVSVTNTFQQNIVNAHNIDSVTINGNGAIVTLTCAEIKSPRTQAPNLADLEQTLFTFTLVTNSTTTVHCSNAGTLNASPATKAQNLIPN